MADKKKNRNKRQNGDQEKPTKEEYAVSKYLRFNVPNKEGKFCGMPVTCFIASDAVDLLLKSKWGPEYSSKTEALLPNRHACVNYCDRLLQKGMFHRAEKVERKKDPGKKKKKRKDEQEEEKAEEKRGTKKDKDKKSKKDKDSEKESDKGEESEKKTDTKDKKKRDEKEESKDEKKEEDKKKKERKLRLDMHDDQRFLDGEEVYVWIYDPVPAKTFIIGLLMVLGAIGLCLFPLWPPEVRLGVYYLSLVAAGFVGFILALIVIRFVLFCAVWVFTIGKHHFWFLPNLTEDVGFFDSFKPLYHHTAVDRSEKKDDKKTDSKSSKKDKSQVKIVESQENDKSSDKEESENEKNSDNDEFEIVEKTDIEEDIASDEKEVNEEDGESENDTESKKDK